MMSYAPGVTDTPLRALSPLSFTQVDLFIFFSREDGCSFWGIDRSWTWCLYRNGRFEMALVFFWLKKTFYFT